MGAAGVLDQTAYRGRFDDGNETGATWFGPENTDWYLQPGQTIRVRYLITVSGGNAGLRAQLQYKLNGADPVNVTTTSPVVRAVDSAHLTHNATTTEQMAGSGSFGAGRIIETGVQTTQLAMSTTTPTETECEFVFEIVPGDVEHLDEIELLLTNVGTLASFTATPTATPTITVAGQLARPVSDEDQGDWVQGGEGEGTLFSQVAEPAHDDATSTIETTSGTCELGLTELGIPAVRTGHWIKFRAKGSDGTGEELEVNLLQGGVAIPLLNPSILLTTNWTDYEYELTEGEAEDITDYAALALEFSGGGTGQTVSVTQAFFITPAVADGRRRIAIHVGGGVPRIVQQSRPAVAFPRRSGQGKSIYDAR